MKRAILGALLLAGCAGKNTTGMYPHGGADVAIQSIRNPSIDRCAHFKAAPDTFKSCQDAKASFTHKLRSTSVGDELCMDSDFGEEPNSTCKARGHVVDADEGGFVIEIRDPALDSKYAQHNHEKLYIENGAMVDLYLRDRGFE